MNHTAFSCYCYLFLCFSSITVSTPFPSDDFVFNNETVIDNSLFKRTPRIGSFYSSLYEKVLVGPSSVSPEAKMTTVEIIASRGYPVETHIVTTDDGYILEVHRIPHGKGQKSSNAEIQRRAVFVQHGFLGTDNVWLITQNNQALAYILADLGYDVWLGNSRGNTYSRKHTTLDPSKSDYWNFSYDEMGKYDIPAVINYVLSKTGRSTMSYVGHSMGCAMFFIAMIERPELNAKIDVMIALAPATSMSESTSSLRYRAPFVNQIMLLYRILGINVYEPVDSFQNNICKRVSGASYYLRYTICKNTLFAATFDDYLTIDVNILPVIDGHNPGGTSVRTAAQLAQNFNAGQTFQPFDFGSSVNQQVYGQSTPPPYDLSKVTCPVYIYWGQNDKTVAPGDIAWLASKLGNLKASIRIEEPLWNHIAFLFSPDAKRLVYDKFIPFLPPTPL